MSNKPELKKLIRSIVKEQLAGMGPSPIGEEATHKILPSRNLSIVAAPAGSDQFVVEFDDNKKAESVKVYLNSKDIMELVKTFIGLANINTKDLAVTEVVSHGAKFSPGDTVSMRSDVEKLGSLGTVVKYDERDNLVYVKWQMSGPNIKWAPDPEVNSEDIVKINLNKLTETSLPTGAMTIKEGGDWEFSSKVDIEFNMPSKDAIQLFGLTGLVDPKNPYVSAYHQKVPLRWRLGFETRDWGIKDMSPYVPDQDIEFEIEYDDVDGNTQQKEVTLKLSGVKTVIDTAELVSSVSFAAELIDLGGIQNGIVDIEVHFRIV